MKGYILVDIPSGCHECKIMFGDTYSFWCPVPREDNINCEVYRFCENKTIPDWCPIKQLPEKFKNIAFEPEREAIFKAGYNQCLDDIWEAGD